MDKLFSFAINEWLNDIRKNQLPGLLSGVGPIHSLVQLGEWAGQAGRSTSSGVQTYVLMDVLESTFSRGIVHRNDQMRLCKEI